MSSQASKPFTTPRTSKIPRPVKSRTDIPKKAFTEVKVRKTLQPLKSRTNSDIKPLRKQIRHQYEPKCRRPILNDIQPESAQLSECDDVHFEPSQQSLDSILNNQGIVPGVNIRESAIQSGKRSSVYYIPKNETSILKSHSEFKQNLKLLQQKMKQLNISAISPAVKKQEAKLPLTPNRPISIYYKIQPLSKDRTGRKLLHQTMSERKVLKLQNSEGLCQSASKLETVKRIGGSVFGLKFIEEKENKSEQSEKSPQLSQAIVSTRNVKAEESNVTTKNDANILAAKYVLHSSVPHIQNCAFDFDSQTCQDFKKPDAREVSGVFSPQQTSHISNGRHGSHQSGDQPLIPLSLLMTPTPTLPSSQKESLFYPSVGTPSTVTPKYSSGLSTQTSSTWAFQDTVSTPKLSQLSTHSCNAEERNPLHSVDHAYKMDKSKSDYKAVHSPHRVQNKRSNATTYVQNNHQEISTPQHTPMAPKLSSCLKTLGKSVDEGNKDGKASCAKKLRWADMSST